MTDEEREALHAGLTTILAVLSAFELKFRALESALQATNPTLYSAYQTSLGTIPAAPIDTALACLNRNLLKTSR
jgi:hypothetical protein